VTDGEDGNGGVVRFIHLSLYYKFGSGASLRGPINHFLVEGRALVSTDFVSRLESLDLEESR